MPLLESDYAALCRQMARVQQRCTALMRDHLAQQEGLQREVMRLRAAVMVRDTQLQQLRDQLTAQAVVDQGGSLPRRKALVAQVQQLLGRVASLTRECVRWQQAAQRPAMALPHAERVHAATLLPMPASAALSVGPAPRAARGEPLASMGTGPIATAVPDTSPQVAYTVAQAFADALVCHAGCMSDNDHWRVQDQCRRTGMACVHAGDGAAPTVLLRVWRVEPLLGPSPAAACGS